MIEFQSLMQAIHKGVKDAAKSVEGETIDFVKRFFDEHLGEEGDAPSYTPKTCNMQFPSRTEHGVENVSAEVPLLALVPVSAPRITEVKFHTELEINTNDMNQLMVSFARKADKPGIKNKMLGQPKNDSSANASLEITLTGNEPPEGLKRLIEGYERALRAQIPG